MDDDEKYIELICNGEFNVIPNFKIGELFESFFDNINYNVVKDNDDVFVDFTGDATCDDEPCTILIKFIIDKAIEEFEIKEVRVNNEILSENEVLDLLDDIAYTGGAVLEDDYCNSNCSTCNHECYKSIDDAEITDEAEEDDDENIEEDDDDKNN